MELFFPSGSRKNAQLFYQNPKIEAAGSQSASQLALSIFFF